MGTAQNKRNQAPWTCERTEHLVTKLPYASSRVGSSLVYRRENPTHYVYRETFLDTCRQYPHFLQIRSLSADDINSDADSTSSETTTIMSESSASSQRRTSVDTSASSVASSGSPLQKISSNPLDDPRRGLTNDPLAVSVILRKACRYDCYCKCHTQDVATKRGFSRAVDPCTDRNCHAFNEATITVSSFFRKALAQVALSRSIKVRYDLSTFRMVSEGSDAMRYVKHGNLAKLKTCVKAGEATLWDTAPDGWSLLYVSLQTLVSK